MPYVMHYPFYCDPPLSTWHGVPYLLLNVILSLKKTVIAQKKRGMSLNLAWIPVKVSDLQEIF